MLRWRIVLGVLLIAGLATLCWLDHLSGLPGAWLMPVALLLSVLASGEIFRLCRSADLKPLGAVVYCGNFLTVLCVWIPLARIHFFSDQSPVGGRQLLTSASVWPLLVLAVFVLLAFLAEICRYNGESGAIANLGATILSLVYVGLMLSVLVQLRLAWGIAALVSLIVVVKMGDTGAYTVGRLVGRHKMSPKLSPGKTIEGGVGAIAFAVLGAWLTFAFIVPCLAGEADSAAAGCSTPWWGWVLFGVAVGVAGLLADLAESLLKRDANCKDSSSWLPGFGGVLDILDSILLAGPIAYIFWALGLVKS